MVQATEAPPAIPDFFGSWSHPALNGLELPLSGAGPVRNLSRERDGIGNRQLLVGDYKNPILQPWAADIVKKFGEMSLAGKGYPTPRNQCWPEQVPFVFANYGMQILQQKDKVTILYPYDHQYRQVRMNQPHPEKVTPSWYGDSVGHYEGDTLVVDTIGMKVGAINVIDRAGSPYSKDLHVVERYRLISYEETKAARERNVTTVGALTSLATPQAAGIDENYQGKGLQVEFTVEDPNVFNTPWSGLATYSKADDTWVENVCAENTHEYYANRDAAIPKADRPDF